MKENLLWIKKFDSDTQRVLRIPLNFFFNGLSILYIRSALYMEVQAASNETVRADGCFACDASSY